jgi:hypothetical protein
MNQLPTETRCRMFHCIAEGNSLRSTARLCDVSLTTVIKFFEDLGRACLGYQSQTFHNFKPRRIQLDEMHSFVGAREKNATSVMAVEKN